MLEVGWESRAKILKGGGGVKPEIVCSGRGS